MQEVEVYGELKNMRKDMLVIDEVYHVFNKSIAGFTIFNNACEYSRMLQVIQYYQRNKPSLRFSKFIQVPIVQASDINNHVKEKLVEIIAYCLMPTHIHLILKQLKEKGISIFMSNILNSCTRYFNIRHKRKGPLWEGRFKNVLVDSDEQLLHLTRYIHLNTVTAYLVEKPEDWQESSYREYLLESDNNNRICKYNNILDITPNSYRRFVEDQISYQRELSKIKDLLIDC